MRMIHFDPSMRPNSKQVLRFFTAHLQTRKKHIYVHEIVGFLAYRYY